MRRENYYLIFFGAGVILQLIHSYVDIKAIWYVGCAFIIISSFLPGGFLEIDFKKSRKKQENNLRESENSTCASTEIDPEQ